VTDEQKLLESLEAEAETEREQILAEARAKSEKIVDEARREADRLIEEARRSGEKRGTVEVDRRVGLARQEVGLAVLEEKHRLLEEARGVLAGRIGELRKHADYPEALQRWTAEVIDGMDDGIDLLVHPDDVADVESVLSDAGPKASVKGDSSILGGVKVVTGDGKVNADNTLQSRFARAQEQLDEVLGQALFGDLDKAD
jgi:V/A-type H+-transporting ATPase subunit E